MKSEERTKKKIKKLSKSLGDIDIYKSNERKKSVNSPFKTSEVIALLILTCIVSFLMGGLVTYRLGNKMGVNLDSELAVFIENYEYIVNNYYDKIDKEKLVDSAIKGMLGTLDKNSNYLGSEDNDFSKSLEGKYKGIGIQVYIDDSKNIKVHSVFDGSPADKAGIKAEDILIKVNDESLEGKSVSETAKIIQSQKGEFSITYKRGDKEKTVKVSLSSVDLPSVVSKTIEKDNKKIGYIYLSIFASNSDEQFKKSLEKLEKEDIYSLIIDLRGNNGGHLTAAENIISLFLDSTHPIYQIESDGKKSKYYSKGKKDKKYRIVVLVDSSSASASEVTTSALKEQYGASVIGVKTYGKGTVQELQTLPNGEQYKLTTKKWLTSKGKQVDGIGIDVDIEEVLDEKYSKNPTEENDNQLQKAISEAMKE